MQDQKKFFKELQSLEGFWSIYREGKFGIAGYLKGFEDEKYYMELNFVETPSEFFRFTITKKISHLFLDYCKEKNIKEGFNLPDFIHGLKNILQKYINVRKESIYTEFQAVKKKFRAIPLNYEIYNLKIIFYINNIYEIVINFKNYPRIPTIKFSENAKSALGTYTEDDLLTEWNKVEELQILNLVSKFEEKLVEAVKIRKSVQKTIYDGVSFKKVETLPDIGPLNLFLYRGEILGIFSPNFDLIELIYRYLQDYNDGSGDIRIFGTALQAFNRNSIAQITHENDLNEEAKVFEELNKLIVDPILLNEYLIASGLINQKNFKIKDLTISQIKRYLIIRALCKGVFIILFKDFTKGLNNTEIGKFWNCVKNLAREFHVSFYVQDEVNLISKSDRILVIGKKGNQLGFGTINELLEKLPKSDSIIELELNRPIEDFPQKLSQVTDLLLIIEVRKFEKYRVFVKNNIENKINELIQKFGSYIFHIKKNIPTLYDYLQLMEGK